MFIFTRNPIYSIQASLYSKNKSVIFVKLPKSKRVLNFSLQPRNFLKTFCRATNFFARDRTKHLKKAGSFIPYTFHCLHQLQVKLFHKFIDVCCINIILQNEQFYEANFMIFCLLFILYFIT